MNIKLKIFWWGMANSMLLYAWAIDLGWLLVEGVKNPLHWGVNIGFFLISLYMTYDMYKKASTPSGIISGSRPNISTKVGLSTLGDGVEIEGGKAKGNSYIALHFDDGTDTFTALMDKGLAEHVSLSILTLMVEGKDKILELKRSNTHSREIKGTVMQLHEIYNHVYGVGETRQQP